MKIFDKILKLAQQIEDNILETDGVGDEIVKKEDNNIVSFISDKYPTYRDVIAKSPYKWVISFS